MKKWLSLIPLLFLLLSFAACNERQELPEPPYIIWPEPCPDWLYIEALSLQEARLDPEFGAHVPLTIPDEFYFLGASRVVTTGGIYDHRSWYMSNGIIMSWQTPGGHWRASPPDINVERVAGSISWSISEATESDLKRIVSPDDDGGWEADWIPVFLAEELTPYVVEAQLEWFDHFGDSYLITSGFGFGVLFGDVLVQIRTISVSPEAVWTMLAEEELSLQEARFDPDFGARVPLTIPDEFYFLGASRIVTPGIYYTMSSGLMISWQTPGGHWRASPPDINMEQVAGRISWRISEATESDFTRIVSPDDDGGWEAGWVPVFLAEELTSDVVKARLELRDFSTGDRWQTTGSGFGVLFRGVLVQISTLDVSPEELWTMLAEIGAGR